MKKILFGLLVSSTLFVSCKKDDDPPVCESTPAAVAGSYKITKVQATFPGVPTTDVTSSFLSDPCDANGVYQLNANGTLVFSTDASCSAAGTGTWTLANNVIDISNDTGGGFDVDGAFSGWNCSSFVVTQDVGGGTGSTLIYTFTKQ